MDASLQPGQDLSRANVQSEKKRMTARSGAAKPLQSLDNWP